MISHPNRSKKSLPIYAKGGFNIRQQEPIGYATSRVEAVEIARQHVLSIAGSANGNEWTNTFVGIELESDNEGRYYVAKRKMTEII